ncbi:MAG: sugar phosphate isomerase/epimerase [Chloroflexi bacterium]|nr:sugar phosphate isomerase/epimerase [Chloroflexota bacterium]
MKIGLAVAPAAASPLAFVVFRGPLESIMDKAAHLGYDGVELALVDAGEIDVERIRAVVERLGLEIPAISTGRVFAERRVWFTHPARSIRRQAVDTVNGLIQIAALFHSTVNIGRVRGFIAVDESRDAAELRFLDCLRECADHAAEQDVRMVIEPVNRYESNYLNSVPGVLDLLTVLDRPNVAIMADAFHMNIEDACISDSLAQAGARLEYVHAADSNRRAPGQGHLDWNEFVGALRSIGYDGYVTAEILPLPNPDAAAADAIRFLRRILLQAA